MTRVKDIDDPEAPIVLIVDNNQMSTHRLSGIFRQKGFQIEICDDGDKAVDEYIRLDPELVVMALDIPSLDGHLAALEMREHGGDCRLVFMAPKRQARLAHDATHSAGALAWIEKPVTASSFELIWKKILGPIPEAPGLQDLDNIHPVEELIEVEPDETPLPLPTNLPPLPVITQPTKKKSTVKKRLVIVLILFTALGAGGWGLLSHLGYLPV
ncbi:MAG: response regulator [Candidatus Poseidoniaceae archaeon]|jgi:CheY-like chemotaxis protein|nr:response regulator [Candidatus Poseidoniaceae archaeon]